MLSTVSERQTELLIWDGLILGVRAAITTRFEAQSEMPPMPPVSQPQVLLEDKAPAARWWRRKSRLLLGLHVPAIDVGAETLGGDCWLSARRGVFDVHSIHLLLLNYQHLLPYTLYKMKLLLREEQTQNKLKLLERKLAILGARAAISSVFSCEQNDSVHKTWRL